VSDSDMRHQEASARMEELAGIFFEVYGRVPTDWSPARVVTAATSYHGWLEWVGHPRTSLTIIRSIIEGMSESGGDNRTLPTLAAVKKQYRQRTTAYRRTQDAPRNDEDRCARCNDDGVTYLWVTADKVIPPGKLLMFPDATQTVVACRCSRGQALSRQMGERITVCSEKHFDGYAQSGRQVSKFLMDRPTKTGRIATEPDDSGLDEDVPF